MKKITSDYWKQRQTQYFKNIEKDEDKLFKQLAKEYNKEAKRLDDLIASYYTKYGEDNVIEYKNLLTNLSFEDKQSLMQDMNTFFGNYPELEHLRPVSQSAYKINRLEALEYEITKQQIELGLKEEQMGLDMMRKGFNETYERVIKDMGFSGVMTRKELMQDIVNSKWIGGRNFSDSIWGNKEKLIDFMTNDFKNGVIRGDNYNTMGNLLKERFNKRSANDIKRLIYTEGTFVQNQAMAKPFEDMGYTHYFYDAIMDERTTDTCEGLNGQRFAFEDKASGDNFPSMHAW